MISRDDSYTPPKKTCILINGGKLHLIDVDNLSIDSNNLVHVNGITIDKEAFILMKNKSVLNPTVKNTKYSLDDTSRITSYYSIYRSKILDTKIFTVSLGHLGYSRYLKTDLEEGGFSQITYYKNTGLIKKKYVDGDNYSSSDLESSLSSPSDVTRSSKVYKNDIKMKKNPEHDVDDIDTTIDEISCDMVKEIALFEYVKSNTNISKYVTEMYHIDLKNSEVYFPKYTELNYKNRHFKQKKHLYQIIYTLYVLHKHGIMHGDLKPSNIYIDKHTGDIKIGDWGLMQIDRTPDWSGKKSKTIQTQSYRAPEVHFSGKYTYKADIWSLGLMLLEASVRTRLMSGSDTYSDVIEMMDKILCCKVKEEYKKNTMNKGAFLKFKKKYKDSGNELVKLAYKMMSPNQDLRPTYEEILSSPYFETFKFQPRCQPKSCVETKIPKFLEQAACKLNLNEDIIRNTCFLNRLLPDDDLYASLALSCKLYHKKLSSVYVFAEELIEDDADMFSMIDTILKKEIQIIEGSKYKLLCPM